MVEICFHFVDSYAHVVFFTAIVEIFEILYFYFQV